MILHDDKKIFIHIPKCGGYSVFHAWLASRPKYMEQFVGAASHTWKRGMSVEGRRPPKKDKDKGTLIINLHATYDRYKMLYPNYKYYTQVRNPYDRWKSMWKHLRNAGLVEKEFYPWTLYCIKYLPKGDFLNCIDRPDLWESAPQMELDMLFYPQWTYIREEVEVHRLEDKTIWKALNLQETHSNKSRKYYAEFDFRGEVKIQKGSSIDINCVFEGKVEIGKNVIIGPGAIVRNSKIGDGSRIEPYTFIENAILEKNVTAGPYAHIGPDAHLEENSEIGNFVEVKRSKIGKGTKAKHLAYIGDGQVAENVNVGAGTIFVNYDGKNKNKTKVGKGAFIGSNSSLIAPIKIGQNSMIGAGSVVTSDVPAERLALGRSRQRNIKKK